jgi:hypothetical protein
MKKYWKLYCRTNARQNTDTITQKPVKFIQTYYVYDDMIDWIKTNGNKQKVYIIETYKNNILHYKNHCYYVVNDDSKRWGGICPKTNISYKFSYDMETEKWHNTNYRHFSELIFSDEDKEKIGERYIINGNCIKIEL